MIAMEQADSEISELAFTMEVEGCPLTEDEQEVLYEILLGEYLPD